MNRYKDFNGNFAILRKLLGGRYRLYIFRSRNLIFVDDFYSNLEAYFALCEYSDSFRRCSRSEFKDKK